MSLSLVAEMLKWDNKIGVNSLLLFEDLIFI